MQSRIDIGTHEKTYRYQVQYEENLDNTIVVDGVPIIDKSKLEKLLTKIAKEFSRKGAPIKPGDIFIPWDDSTGKSKGYEPHP
jgi:translation initiation factor 3 subunit B